MKQAEPADARDGSTPEDLEEELRVLERRLRDGEDKVRGAKDSGGDRDQIERWESAWIRLLQQYELVYARLRRIASQSRTGDAR